MLLAVTPNPALDRILELKALRPGQVHRTDAVQVSAGGKGLNVVRAARCLGVAAEAVCPLGGPSGTWLESLASDEGLPLSVSQLADGQTRTCLLLNHAAGDTTVVNEAGPRVGAASWTAYIELVRQRAGQASAVALCGSVPPGIEEDGLRELLEVLRSTDSPACIDTSGAALETAMRRPAGFIFKVNATEFEGAASDASLQQARKLVADGAREVLVTRGAGGAFAVTPAGGWLARAPAIEALSSVGSGDAFLAGYTIACLEGRGTSEALRFAVACGGANTRSYRPGDLEASTVRDLEENVEIERLGD